MFLLLLFIHSLPFLSLIHRQYRRECLRHLNSDLREELLFMDSFAEENPKNYQIWYHRRAIVEQLGEAGNELAFCSKVFETDAKNYHAWAHR
jgi:protein farnesyltransferase/geranylgeranyltransferase type-1 subunit alpha